MSKLLTTVTLIASLLMTGCGPIALPEPAPQPVTLAATSDELSGILVQSWQAYRQRFIQGDGRVIDREANAAPRRKVRPTPCCGPYG